MSSQNLLESKLKDNIGDGLETGPTFAVDSRQANYFSKENDVSFTQSHSSIAISTLCQQAKRFSMQLPKLNATVGIF